MSGTFPHIRLIAQNSNYHTPASLHHDAAAQEVDHPRNKSCISGAGHLWWCLCSWMMDLIFALAPPTWTKHELVWSKWNAFEKNCQLKYDGWMGSKRQDYHHQQHPHINPKRVSQTKWHECEERLQRKWQHLIGLQTCRLTGPEMTPEYIVLPGTMIANEVAGKSPIEWKPGLCFNIYTVSIVSVCNLHKNNKFFLFRQRCVPGWSESWCSKLHTWQGFGNPSSLT